MKQHIILTAFGTTTLAQNTYNYLDSLIKSRFPKSITHWYFSSPTVRKRSLSDILEESARSGDRKIVVQSVHVTPGHEFHQMVRKVHAHPVPAAIGMPLLTSPTDYNRVAQALMPLIDTKNQDAILILGHGTLHPSWTAIPAFEKIMRTMAGDHVFVAALEKYPLSENVIDEIASKGFTRLLIIPLLITAGMHFKRDIIGDSPKSWQSRLKTRGIELSFHNEGLGMLNGIPDIICDHIEQAMDSPIK